MSKNKDDTNDRKPQEIAVMADSDPENCDMIRDVSGQIYIYKNNLWNTISNNAAKALMFKYDIPGKSSIRRRSESLEYLLCLDRQIDNVGWNNIKESEIPFSNGVWDAHTGTIRDHRREDWLDAIIPHKCPEDTSVPPVVGETLAQWWGHEPDFGERMRALAQFMGYTLLAHNRYKKALMLIGPRDTGKSALLHIMQHLVGGRDYVSAVQLRDLGDAKSIAPIRGKRLNVVADIGSGEHLDDAGFKAITGGDEIQINQKYMAAITYRPSVKFALAANSAPRITDRTDATFERLLVFTFTKQFSPAEKDPQLVDKIKADFEPWLRFAMSGAKDLVTHGGQWCVPPSSQEFIDEYHKVQNPVFWFFDDTGAITGLSCDFAATSDLVNAFNSAKVGGKSWGHNAVTEAIKGLNIPQIQQERMVINGRKRRGWIGINLRKAAD